MPLRHEMNSLCALTHTSVGRSALLCSFMLLLITSVSADGPITVAECYLLNPTYQNKTCQQLYGEVPPEKHFLLNLPWSKVAAYQQCVQERCACSGQPVPKSTTNNGMYCNAEKKWTESGFMTCNDLMGCMSKFWTCATDVLMSRYEMDAVNIEPEERAAVNAIAEHGQVIGQPFEGTAIYNSCRMITCQAAQSRQNCGLCTCLPDYSQCDEYIKPPPAPFLNQACTVGCHVALYLMALTIVVIVLALACCWCCPSRVKVIQPVVFDNKNV